MTDLAPKVLTTDDDPTILKLLDKILVSSGYQVDQADNGTDALAAVKNDPPDFLVTDWDMPGINGLELCRRVRDLDLPHYVYILILTASADPKRLIEGFDAGADDFLTKPFRSGELLGRLRAGSRVVALERRLRCQAKTDPLTGIDAKKAFGERCVKELSRAKRYGLDLSCVMFDVDYFKRINDVHGHAAGDNVLKAIAGVLSSQCRESDLVCRYGGDEFCVLLAETAEAEAAQWSERVRRTVSELRFNFGDSTIKVTSSFGVAGTSGDVCSPDDLLEHADQALLAAKRTGRDRVVCYGMISESGDLMAGPENGNQLFRDTLARDIMTSPVAYLNHSDSISQAVEYFVRFRINSAPVVDDNGCMVGIVSEKDCIAVLHAPNSWKMTVDGVMSRNVIGYEEDTPVKIIQEFFCRTSIRRVIITKDGHPTGVVSRSTLLRWYHHWVTTQCGESSERLDANASMNQLREVADCLAEEANSLRDMLASTPEFLVPIVLDGTTRIQELATNLLAYSRTSLPDDFSTMDEVPML